MLRTVIIDLVQVQTGASSSDKAVSEEVQTWQ